MIKEYHRQQLHPGDKFQAKLSWDGIKSRLACRSSTANSIAFSLWDWCNEVLINGTTSAYYGKKIFEINLDLLKANKAWERSSWKYMYKLPQLLAKDMFSAKDEIVTTLRKYLESPKEERADALCFVTAIEDELRAFTFWTVTYLIHNPALLDLIREGVKPALDGDSLNLKYLTEKCPRLEALFNEVLLSPTVIGEIILHKGTRIISFPRIDDTKPGLGILAPVEGDNVILVLKRNLGTT
ncbi:hypothetical protein B0O99DRAFT_651000 [Bisporella sp. PMI_857]|nr:hypothetical protein B0O99DRAFT_651000 [Bisporella sp. PMI_857]